MSLPNPIPDDPRKWEGWNQYRSSNYYDRLCLDWRQSPSNAQIEDHCRQLLVWWQKKLPLKNQPSNPIAQMLRSGLDEAPLYLTEARSKLLEEKGRAEIDNQLRELHSEEQIKEIRKYLLFSISSGRLSRESQTSLYQFGHDLGLSEATVDALIEQVRTETPFELDSETPLAEPEPEPEPSHPGVPPRQTQRIPVTDDASATEELLRLMRMANIEDNLSYEQQQTFIGMGQSLGLGEEEAERIVEQFADELIFGPSGAPSAPPKKTAKTSTKPIKEPAAPKIELTRAEELSRFTSFKSSIGCEMLFIPSGEFTMGAKEAPAAEHEKPLSNVKLTRYYFSRLPITNAQYEQFDPSHKSKRAPWADDEHPVVYVSHQDAVKFCQWLSKQEKRRYRLPTEAEWEFAARGEDGRMFPWGNDPSLDLVCNFADAQSSFAWSDRRFDCGFAQTSPVGSFPRGASPFGPLDMAGNINEWVHDYFDTYKGGDQRNPKGPNGGTRRVYRGGSWRTRLTSCRTTARAFNTPDYQFNDLGFRIACDCEPV